MGNEQDLRTFGFIEILEKTTQSLLGAPAHSVFTPAAQTSPTIAIAPGRLMTPTKEEGEGMLHYGLPPPMRECAGIQRMCAGMGTITLS
jgi:hypothetical protein